MNDKQFKKCMDESVKIIDGVTVIKESGDWYCDYEDYLKAGKPRGEKDFCDWCDDNNLIPVG
jgi:hypothetical protein